MGKCALITGIRGQDGAYLARSLLEDGYRVYGADRRSGDTQHWRMKELDIYGEVEIIYMDLLEMSNVYNSIEKIAPDEIYNLAAQSFVASSFEQPIVTCDVNAMGVLRLLEAMRRMAPKARLYQASTSEMFGLVQETPQRESTPFYPRSPYGVSKLFSHWMCVNYREAYDIFACSGILFNHESPIRGVEFVTRKITRSVASICNGSKRPIVLGNLDSKRDWGYAGDYVEAMKLMLRRDVPDDFVIATGETHSIRDFVEKAFQVIDIDVEWKGKGIEEKGINSKNGDLLVEVSDKFYRPAEVELLLGDPSKAKEKLGWEPKVSFNELVEMMVCYDLKTVKEHRNLS